MQRDENDDECTLEAPTSFGWTAPRQVVSRHTQETLREAMRIAHETLNNPSERTVMRLFQTMIDRTSLEDTSPVIVH